MIPQPIDQVPLFLRLSQEERELVTTRLRRRQAAAGEIVFSAGRPSDTLFVVASGWVKLEDVTSDRTVTLANLGAGSLLGEVDTLLGRPYSTSARSAAHTQLLTLSRPDLEDLISQHPSIGLKFSAALGMRVAFLEQYLVQQRLRNIELLSALSEDDLRAIARKLDFKSFSRGDLIVEAGAPGDAVFLIEEGRARLITESNTGELFEELGDGALFGHTALITGKPYPATARAVSDVSVWLLSRSVYQDLIREHPAVKLAFSRALAEALGPSDQADAIERIHQLPLFSDVPTEALSALVARLVLRHFPAGEIIYADGTPGDALYVVESGEVKLLDSASSDTQLLERVRAGAPFGEMALLTGRTRAECARAFSDATVWVLYKTDFDDLMVQYPEISVSLSRALSERLATRENDFLERHLRRIALFSSLASSELRAISKKVHGLRFRAGEIICFAGQPAQTLFMIERGEVKRIGVGPAGEPVILDLLGPGDYFGEQAIVQNSAYHATAQAIGEVELWTIAKSAFDVMLEQYPALAVTVTRLMADRLARTQPLPTRPPRGRAPTSPRALTKGRGVYGPPSATPPRAGATAPRGATPQPRRGVPTPPRAPGARPGVNIPPPGARIQQPPSGARPIPKPTPPKPPRQKSSQAHTTAPAIQPQPIPADAPRVPLSHYAPAAAVTDQAQSASVDVPPSAVPVARPRARRPENTFFKELGAWLARLSTGAKLRIAALGALVAYIAFIAFPATAITTVSSAVGGLQIFNPPAVQTGSPASPNKPTPTRGPFGGGILPKIARAVATETPIPTKTPLPTSTPRPRPTSVPATRTPVPPPPAAAAPAALAATPIPTLPPIYWDPRLGNGPNALPRLEVVKLVPAQNVGHGQKFWRVVRVKFEDVSESGSDHTIYVKVLGESGNRVEGKKLHLTSVGALSEYPDEKPAGDLCDCNFNYPMYGDGYNVQIEDQYPSDQVVNMIMPLNQHVNYRVTFQLTTNP